MTRFALPVAFLGLTLPLICSAQATITVFAGTGNPPITPGAIGDGGAARNAFLDGPESVTFDASGNLYIRESARVRKVTPAGIISTIAGDGTTGFAGDNGPATSARIGVGPQRAGRQRRKSLHRRHQ
jgi:serine/threonine-protein kinase